MTVSTGFFKRGAIPPVFDVYPEWVWVFTILAIISWSLAEDLKVAWAYAHIRSPSHPALHLSRWIPEVPQTLKWLERPFRMLDIVHGKHKKALWLKNVRIKLFSYRVRSFMIIIRIGVIKLRFYSELPFRFDIRVEFQHSVHNQLQQSVSAFFSVYCLLNSIGLIHFQH